MHPGAMFAIIWIGWALSWIAAATWSARTEKRVALASALSYRIPIIAGAILLWHRAAQFLHESRLWHVGTSGAWLLAAATLAGILFAWWARLHLGRLWSGAVTRKEGHRVIDTGPYGLVRHPIYTGLLFATLATATAEATLTGIAGFALITYGLWLKARLEERFLASELPAGDYDTYRRRVPMLVPYLPA